MKSIAFLILVVLVQLHTTAQIEFNSKAEYNNYAFGGLASENITTGLLIDQSIEHFDRAWERYKVTSDSVKTQLNMNDFFVLYQNIENAQILENLILPMDSIIFPLFNKQFTSMPWENGQKIPVMIIDYDVNKISNRAIINGNISYTNGQYFDGVNAEEGYIEKKLFGLVPFADSIRYNNVSLIFDPNFIFTNNTDEIIEIILVIENDTLYANTTDEVDISQYVDSDGIFEVTINFLSGKEIHSSFSLNKSGGVFSYEPNDGTDFFDEIHSFSLNNDSSPNWMYGIKFGCGNTSIRKPVILVSGYGAFTQWDLVNNQAGLPTGLMDLYIKYNLEGLCEELLATGHDVIIVRFEPSNGDLVEQSIYLSGIITEINDMKYANNSYHETSIIGYSGGAISTRLALDKMEYDYINNNGPHPHCKLYISFEGEHQGVNIPLGAQLALEALYDHQGGLGTDGVLTTANIELSVLHYLIHTPMTQQLLTYYYDQTGKVGETVAQQNCHGERTLLLNHFNEFNHPKQLEKYGYYGYPAFSRTVAVVDGANGYNAPNTPYLFDAGHLIYEHDAPFSLWSVWNTDNYQILNPNPAFHPSKTVFKYTKLNIFGGFEYIDEYITSDEIQVLDNAPGGFLVGGEDAMSLFFNEILPAKLNNDATVSDYITTASTPTISTLDIKNYDLLNYQAHYDIQANRLMFNVFDFVFTSPSFSFGFPSLYHPFTHFSWTPFEGIYCDELNKTHINSQNLNTDGDLVNNKTGDIKNYIFYEEIEPYVMHLQNLKIGWNANSSDVYKVDYEAKTLILVGRHVTPKTDIAPFIVQANGDVTFKSEGAIIFEVGFITEPGANVYAYIGPIDYNADCVIPPTNKSAEIVDDYSENTEPETDIQEKGKSTVIIYPNPSIGVFVVELDDSFDNNLFTIQIFDLSGKLMYQNLEQNQQKILVNLENGLYVVRISQENNVVVQKLIVNQ